MNLSDAFSKIGSDGCMDVATSLALQGINPSNAISIPIYEVFRLNILLGDNIGRLACNTPEFEALRLLTSSCGAVGADINVFGVDALSLIGLVMIFTPNTGMNVFIRDIRDTIEGLDDTILDNLAALVGMPFKGALNVTGDVTFEIINQVFNKLFNTMDANLQSCNISLRNWESLPALYDELTKSGELVRMMKHRQMINAAIF